ncbi:MAG: hypothetical protein M1358_02735 [Chloroflexi bacterium]|nr:hypothetical protein [Chloroflexota bacterium]
MHKPIRQHKKLFEVAIRLFGNPPFVPTKGNLANGDWVKCIAARAKPLQGNA